jgi:hypothetical protein
LIIKEPFLSINTISQGVNEMDFTRTALRWYKKSCNDDDNFDQFISIWISFNAIYGLNIERNEFDKIKSVVRQFSDQQIGNILSSDAINFFCDMNTPIQFINLDGEIQNTRGWQRRLVQNRNTNPRVALENLLSILNKVRNNLFHGDKLLDRTRDVDIVKHAYPIVKAIVQEFLQIPDETPELIESNIGIITAAKIEFAQKFNDLKLELENITEFLYKRPTIEKNGNHPVSILMRHYFVWDLIGWDEEVTPELLKEYQEGILKEYNSNKPEVIMDIDQAYSFISHRINQIIEGGLSKDGLKRLRKEFIELQRNFLEKGYDIHT